MQSLAEQALGPGRTLRDGHFLRVLQAMLAVHEDLDLPRLYIPVRVHRYVLQRLGQLKGADVMGLLRNAAEAEGLEGVLASCAPDVVAHMPWEGAALLRRLGDAVVVAHGLREDLQVRTFGENASSHSGAWKAQKLNAAAAADEKAVAATAKIVMDAERQKQVLTALGRVRGYCSTAPGEQQHLSDTLAYLQRRISRMSAFAIVRAERRTSATERARLREQLEQQLREACKLGARPPVVELAGEARFQRYAGAQEVELVAGPGLRSPEAADIERLAARLAALPTSDSLLQLLDARR